MCAPDRVPKNVIAAVYAIRLGDGAHKLVVCPVINLRGAAEGARLAFFGAESIIGRKGIATRFHFGGGCPVIADGIVGQI